MCEGGRERGGCISFFLSFFLSCMHPRKDNKTQHSIKCKFTPNTRMDHKTYMTIKMHFTPALESKEGRTLKHGTKYIYACNSLLTS
jgi:hypothetical protein